MNQINFDVLKIKDKIMCTIYRRKHTAASSHDHTKGNN